LPDLVLGWQETEAAAPGLGVELLAAPVGARDNLGPAIEEAQARGAEALVVLSDDVTFVNRAEIFRRANALGLPTIGPQRAFGVSGALLSYGPDYPELFARAAVMVDKLLRGASPRDIPVEQPRKFELVVNVKTAALLGLTLPRSLLNAVTEAIQ
jgi:putative ABC transport system substrate-binding protein